MKCIRCGKEINYNFGTDDMNGNYCKCCWEDFNREVVHNILDQKDQQIAVLKKALELAVEDWCIMDNPDKPSKVIEQYLKQAKENISDETTNDELKQQPKKIHDLAKEVEQLKQSQNSKAIECLEKVLNFIIDSYENYYPEPYEIKILIEDQIAELEKALELAVEDWCIMDNPDKPSKVIEQYLKQAKENISDETTNDELKQQLKKIYDLAEEVEQLKQSQNSKAIECLKKVLNFIIDGYKKYYPEPYQIEILIEDQLAELRGEDGKKISH